MRLEQYRCLWGVVNDTDGHLARSPHETLDTAIPALKALGYDGVELAYKTVYKYGRERFKRLLEVNGLKVNFVIFTDGPVCPGGEGVLGGPYAGYTAPSAAGETDKEKLIQTHLKVFQEQVEGAQFFNPTVINSHSLKDYFTFEMGERWFRLALDWCKSKGYDNVMHEGHRGRFLYSPWVARDFVPRFPELKLVADLSHWVNVAETNSDDLDLTQVIEDLAPQVYHTHCRVGYNHGPQVPDPRSPEWLPYMEGHERWWDAIWKAQAKRGQKVSTQIAEHGPPPYQPCIPGSRQPVAHIWDVNHWIHLRRQIRFAQFFGQENTSRIIPSGSQNELPETNPGPSVLEGKGRVGFKSRL